MYIPTPSPVQLRVINMNVLPIAEPERVTSALARAHEQESLPLLREELARAEGRANGDAGVVAPRLRAAVAACAVPVALPEHDMLPAARAARRCAIAVGFQHVQAHGCA